MDIVKVNEHYSQLRVHGWPVVLFPNGAEPIFFQSNGKVVIVIANVREEIDIDASYGRNCQCDCCISFREIVHRRPSRPKPESVSSLSAAYKGKPLVYMQREIDKHIPREGRNDGNSRQRQDEESPRGSSKREMSEPEDLCACKKKGTEYCMYCL